MASADIKSLGIFLGGMRCGSTAVNDYMKQHPQVLVSGKKDPHFFSGDEVWEKGWKPYLRNWKAYNPDRHRIAFESSTHYTKFPMYKDTAFRMASSPFNMRLMYGVRPPIARIESHFAHNFGKGYFDASNARERQKLLRQAINVSNYSMQLANFQKYFAPSQIMIIETERLIVEPDSVLSEVCNFLGIDSDFNFEEISRRPRKFKNDVSNLKLTQREIEIASEALFEQTIEFEKIHGIQIWDGLA